MSQTIELGGEGRRKRAGHQQIAHRLSSLNAVLGESVRLRAGDVELARRDIKVCEDLVCPRAQVAIRTGYEQELASASKHVTQMVRAVVAASAG